MGRNAGWLTGASALSKGEDCEGPDLIYLPELPFDVEKFVEKVKSLLEKKHFGEDLSAANAIKVRKKERKKDYGTREKQGTITG